MPNRSAMNKGRMAWADTGSSADGLFMLDYGH
jgi:hypothetical protein